MMTLTVAARESWLEARRSSLGASEAAAALGVSPYATPIELWQRKLGLAAEQPENEAMRWGTLLEPLILREYQDRTGLQVVATQERRIHPDHSCLTATLDARCDDGRIVEVKTASAWAKEWGEEGSDDVPEPYLVQVAQQMACSGAGRADLVVLIGGQRLKVYEIPRDDALIARVVEGGLRFWRCVENREPPTWGRLDAAALAVLHPQCQGVADWSLEDADAVGNHVLVYETSKADIKLLEERAEHARGHILQALGSAQIGRLPDGRVVKRFLRTEPPRQVSYVTKETTKHYFMITKGTQ